MVKTFQLDKYEDYYTMAQAALTPKLTKENEVLMAVLDTYYTFTETPVLKKIRDDIKSFVVDAFPLHVSGHLTTPNEKEFNGVINSMLKNAIELAKASLLVDIANLLRKQVDGI
jgi:hypothetical protein